MAQRKAELVGTTVGVVGGAVTGATYGARIGIVGGGIAMAGTVPVGIVLGALYGLAGNKCGSEIDRKAERRSANTVTKKKQRISRWELPEKK